MSDCAVCVLIVSEAALYDLADPIGRARALHSIHRSYDLDTLQQHTGLIAYTLGLDEDFVFPPERSQQ